MAIEQTAARVPLSPAKRLDGLNHIAEVRAQVFGRDIEPELERFISQMRDAHSEHRQRNMRVLAALFYMARLPAERHGASVSDLTVDEKRALIIAMNHFRAAVSLFPKRLAMPV
ncbi:DUF5347 family protein [Erwinia sp. SLM-02]|uniref:DUF5347 family protein n=1 Tax=Erwinia sp. SLM-02 TaxID=3020057 RepID=UPI0028D75055|nr:DUF5347 family protein [uncultured Erwinia sp.]